MTPEKIKFSIIIPTYNRAHLITSAIQSVINQTFCDWELLVCDDASADGTKDLVDSFRDTRIKYFRLPVNKGNAAARNLGLQNSSNNWITFIDSDDQYDPDYLNAFAKAIVNNPQVYFFFCGYRVTKENHVETEFIWRPDNSKRQSFLSDLKIGIGCGVVIHKHCFDQVGDFDSRLRASVDTDFLIRLEMKYSFHVVEQILISISAHEGPRVRKNPVTMMEAYQLIVEKNNEIIFGNKNLLRRWYYKLMWLQYHANNVHGGNASFLVLKKAKCVDLKSRFIHILFNIFPLRVALFVHKKLSV